MSERLSASLVEIEEEWSIDDVYLAHDVLDAYDEAERRAYERASRKGRR